MTSVYWVYVLRSDGFEHRYMCHSLHLARKVARLGELRTMVIETFKNGRYISTRGVHTFDEYFVSNDSIRGTTRYAV